MWNVYRYFPSVDVWLLIQREFSTEQDAQVELAKLTLKDGGQYRIVKEE